MKDYDLIIVGGGPAGSTAGYLLSRLGLKVLILDKSKFPRKKLCAGLITHKTGRLLERVFGETPDTLKEKGIINFESNSYEVLHKRRSLAVNRFDIPFYFVDRYHYDSFLLEKARGAGAEVIEGDAVVTCDPALPEVTTSSGRKLRAGFLLGADGIQSIVRRSFSESHFNTNEWNENLAMGLELFADRAEFDMDITHPMIFFGVINYGYAWIFPNKDRVVAGICGLQQKNDKPIKQLFDEFLAQVGFTGGMGQGKVKGHPLPFGNFLKRPAFQNTALAGDAAGFTDPIFAEGIFYAQRSAELLSQAVLTSIREGIEMEKGYHQLLQKYLLPELISAKRNRWFFYNRTQKQFLKTLFNVLGKRSSETVHGMRSHRWFRRPDGETI
jgi:geranylgeranyl reductase family protein